MNDLSFKSKQEVKQFHDSALTKLIAYLNEKSPFYNRKFASGNTDISKIKTIDDLRLLPVTTKEDLHAHNMDFLCVDRRDIVEYCSTSGTLGTPVTIGLTENDLQRLAYNEYCSFINAGCTSDDILLLMLSLDRQFMAGIAYFLGGRKLGAGIIRGGPGNFAMQLETIYRLQPTALVAVPSFIVGLIGFSKEKGIDLNTTSVKKIICIGENIRDENLKPNAISNRITSFWNVHLFSTYASTEQQTAFTECQYGSGGHHQPELLIYEILDENNLPVQNGFPGELTITTLGVEGMPFLRYKTGDICAMNEEPCQCGRTSARITPILGRKKQLIKYKGTTLYPQSLFNVLNSIDIIEDYVIEVTRNELTLDEIKIFLALKPSAETNLPKIIQAIQSSLRVLPEIKTLSLPEIQKLQLSEGKRKISKLIDYR